MENERITWVRNYITMRHKALLILSLLFIFNILDLKAQDAISTAGGNALGSGGTISYTVGQIFYSINTGENGSVAQGIQQPYEISIISEIEDDVAEYITCCVYPNPVIDVLTLKIGGEMQLPRMIFLYDINGILLQSKIVEACETNISLSNLMPATYLLKVMQGDKELKVFKIVKK